MIRTGLALIGRGLVQPFMPVLDLVEWHVLALLEATVDPLAPFLDTIVLRRNALRAKGFK